MSNQDNGHLEFLDPNTLVLDTNVRTEANLTKDFLASIAEHGVLEPVGATRDADGTVRVRLGQRRTLAARKAGLASIPVYITEAPLELIENTVERVTTQIVENDQRQELTNVERVLGIQELLGVGMSQAKIAKKLSVPPATIKAAKAIGASQLALDELKENSQLTFAEAAVLAEFDGDEQALVRLRNSVGHSSFEHVAAQLRERRKRDEKLDKAAESYREVGFTTVDHWPSSFDEKYIALDRLETSDGGDVTKDATTANPKLWAVHLIEETVLVDKKTGEFLDEEWVDWTTEGRPDAEPEEGLRHADSVEEREAFVADYYCIDVEGAGLRLRKRPDRPTRAGEAGQQTPMAAAEAAKAEKRERRKVIALNRLGDAAQQVRREFVKAMLERKTPPQGAAIFIAKCLTDDGHLLSDYHAGDVTAELLGVDSVRRSRFEYGVRKDKDESQAASLGAVLDALPDTGDPRALVITLGLVLGALENRTPKDEWRKSVNEWSRAVGAKCYLEFLAANGYTLAPVEEVMTGKLKADKVYNEYLAH